MPIHLLPPEVASQIAAGEVVERPASVVKELLENALDAGATVITITIEGAGQRLIEIADNGKGIPPSELALAVERHATSKLTTAQDLFEITTLGFRGEALASIASVARLTLVSRQPESEVGARIRVEGGYAEAVEAAGAPVGTLIRVEELFYNVPARLKFLKSGTSERRQIDQLVTRYALAYPHVRFSLKQEGRPALQTSGQGSRREVLGALYGAETARQMLEVQSVEEDLQVEGFVSPASLTRANRAEIFFFVNGRPIHDPALVAALARAYHTLLMVGRHPLAALFISLPPEMVDVNVHPAKAEVRFRQPDRIFSGVQRAVRRALLAHTQAPGLDVGLRWGEDAAPADTMVSPPLFPSPWGGGGDGATGYTSTGSGFSGSGDAGTTGSAEDGDSASGQTFWTPSETGAPPAPPPRQTELPANRLPLLRLVGQVANTYLAAEGPDGLYLVDQHAAHERVLFERFMDQLAPGIPRQALLQAVSVDLPPASARLVAEQLPILERLGFQVEPFGPNSFLVRAIPALLIGADPGAALRVLVEDFEEDETPLQAEIEARIIARVCKRAAIKGGQSMAPEEQKALLLDLENCRSPRTCPHGRPTMIHLSVDLLERQFGRRGAR